MSTTENKSYLAAGMNALSPWGSRSNTPRPGQNKDEGELRSELGQQRGGDHTVGNRHRLSLRDYPRDCPPLQVQWFHAVDVPKRKPRFGADAIDTAERLPIPKKFVTFNQNDSRAIEAKYQKLTEENETSERGRSVSGTSPKQFRSRSSSGKGADSTVPVNEDYLFDVNIDARELAPAYWLGPVYEVVRGTWFYQEGTRQRPCDENLSAQLEEGYLKTKPWRTSVPSAQQTPSQPRPRPSSMRADGETAKALRQIDNRSLSAQSSSENLRPLPTPAGGDRATRENEASSGDSLSMRAHRLFGAHMGSVVTFENANTAWILTDTLLSQVSSTVYQRFAGGGHFAGIRLTRGYDEKASKSTEDGKSAETSNAKAASASGTEYGDSNESAQSKDSDAADADHEPPASPAEERRKILERKISTLATSTGEKAEEEVRKRQEEEMRADYSDGDDQGRPIEHLLLVTHGIGQRLGLRMESVNFVHDVNTLRKTLKGSYAASPDLQLLNGEIESLPKNSRVQVLPICWRHLLDFPKQSLKHNRKEYDLGEANSEDQEYPNLDDITVEGVPAVRNLLTDLALDILLYQSPAYKAHISRIVLQECNRIYKLFKQRNPAFNGKVSLIGHSLGSAIMFDLLCKQEESQRMSSATSSKRRKSRPNPEESLEFDFPVQDFYALGSPIGLFQMLRGRTIAARHKSFKPAQTPGDPMDDPFLTSTDSSSSNPLRDFDIVVSSPKCEALFNLFHPSDPVSYRIEPLISPAMSSLKPQPLPYTKKGIFGAPVGQGLTGIGQRVGQSVSGFWSSFSTGIASSLLNRSLGITAEDTAKAGNPINSQLRAPSGSSAQALIHEERQRRLTVSTQDSAGDDAQGDRPPTLIDSEMDTLFAGFEKRRKSEQGEGGIRELDSTSAEWAELEERSRKMRKEEAKVRALNSNGRVDYAIQEGAFDISLIASIASHLSYWADEDVGHFMLSQLLSRQRVMKVTDKGLKKAIQELEEQDLGSGAGHM